MHAGADCIKTTTGKISPSATMEVVYVMLNAIKDFYKETGIKIGMKPAGGISTAKNVLESEDVISSISNLRRLGVKIERVYPQTYKIYGKGLGGFKYKNNR